MRNSPLKGMLNAASPIKQRVADAPKSNVPKPKKKVVEKKAPPPPKKRVNIKTGKHEMHTGTKTNPVTGEKTETYSAY